MRGTGDGFAFKMSREIHDEAIDQRDSGQTAVLGDLDHEAAGLLVDSRDRVARLGCAIQF